MDKILTWQEHIQQHINDVYFEKKDDRKKTEDLQCSAVPIYGTEVSEALVIEKWDRNAIQSPETCDTVYLFIKYEIKTSRIS